MSYRGVDHRVPMEQFARAMDASQRAIGAQLLPAFRDLGAACMRAQAALAEYEQARREPPPPPWYVLAVWAVWSWFDRWTSWVAGVLQWGA